MCRVSSAVWVPDALAAEYCLFVSRCRHVRLSWAVEGFCDAVGVGAQYGFTLLSKTVDITHQ